MRRVMPCLLLAACAATPLSDYVPGGADLPQDARIEYRRALALEHSGEPEEALQKIADLCSRYPTRIAFHLRRLRLAQRTRGREYASRLYDPPPPGVDRLRAEILTRIAEADESDLTDMTNVLLYAIEQEPGEAHWHLGLADVRIAGHDPLMEQADVERRRGALDAAKDAAERARGLLDRARDRAEHSLELDPLFAEAHILIGYILTRIADGAETGDEKRRWRRDAEKRYDRALELDPESLPALLNRAENSMYFDRYTAATDDLVAASSLAPAVALVWSNLGSVYFRIGRLQHAVDAYGKALALEPEASRTRAAYADCLHRRGDAEGAVRELERARENAGDDDALRAEIAFKLGTIHEHQREYRRAVSEYKLHIEHGERVGVSGAKAQSRIQHIVDHAFEDAG